MNIDAVRIAANVARVGIRNWSDNEQTVLAIYNDRDTYLGTVLIGNDDSIRPLSSWTLADMKYYEAFAYAFKNRVRNG